MSIPETIMLDTPNTDVTYGGDMGRFSHEEQTQHLLDLALALREYRRQLREAGFRVIGIPTSSYHASSFRTYSNAIPIVQSDGTTTIIMPSFHYQNSDALEQTIRETLEQEGFEVIFVIDQTRAQQGNVHCITNALE